MNGPAIARFRFLVGGLWHRALARRSHTGYVSWARMRRLIGARALRGVIDRSLGVLMSMLETRTLYDPGRRRPIPT